MLLPCLCLTPSIEAALVSGARELIARIIKPDLAALQRLVSHAQMRPCFQVSGCAFCC